MGRFLVYRPKGPHIYLYGFICGVKVTRSLYEVKLRRTPLETSLGIDKL